MSIVKIGLVTEGRSDQVVIKELLSSFISSVPNVDWQLEFIDLQPSPSDKTSSSSVEGGWLQVYKWCRLNPPEARQRLYLGESLFANNMDSANCDLILVHMDADICGNIGDKTTITPTPQKNDIPTIRGSFIKAVVFEWLWPEPEYGNSDSKHIIAPAVESVEAWLVAGLTSDDLEPEVSHEIQKRLAVLVYEVIKKRTAPVDIKRPDKSPPSYKKISEVASKNIDRILERCPHFKTLSTEVFAAINGVT